MMMPIHVHIVFAKSIEYLWRYYWEFAIPELAKFGRFRKNEALHVCYTYLIGTADVGEMTAKINIVMNSTCVK